MSKVDVELRVGIITLAIVVLVNVQKLQPLHLQTLLQQKSDPAIPGQAETGGRFAADEMGPNLARVQRMAQVAHGGPVQGFEFQVLFQIKTARHRPRVSQLAMLPEGECSVLKGWTGRVKRASRSVSMSSSARLLLPVLSTSQPPARSSQAKVVRRRISARAASSFVTRAFSSRFWRRPMG